MSRNQTAMHNESKQFVTSPTHDKEWIIDTKIFTTLRFGKSVMISKENDTFALPVSLLDQIRRDAVADVSKYYINLLVKQKEETKKELLDVVAKDPRFSCLESWCKTRWFNVDKGNNYGELRDDYCANCKAINKIRAKTLGEQVKKE